MVKEFVAKYAPQANFDLDNEFQLEAAKSMFRFVTKDTKEFPYQTMLEEMATMSAQRKKRMEQKNGAKNEKKSGKSALKKTLASGMAKG